VFSSGLAFVDLTIKLRILYKVSYQLRDYKLPKMKLFFYLVNDLNITNTLLSITNQNDIMIHRNKSK
jgi:hypothetical protein